MRWVKKRKPTQPPIDVIAAFEKDTRTTRAFQHTCSRCIRDLLLVGKIRREDDRIGVVATASRLEPAAGRLR